MKKTLVYILFLQVLILGWGCKKDNYPGGGVSPYIAIFDIKNLYKGNDVTLSLDNMFGADKITGIVISDHSGGNLPAGLLVLQDNRRLSQLRGISIPLGAEAASYVPGDSVVINVDGAVLKKVNDNLQLTGVSNSDITKISSGNSVEPVIVKADKVLASPASYESTLISIAKVGFDPSYPENTTYAGDKISNDGFGNFTLHTEAGAEFANDKLPFMANYSGILFNSTDADPQLWPRGQEDIIVLSATAPKISAIVVTGYLIDPAGSDSLYEY